MYSLKIRFIIFFVLTTITMGNCFADRTLSTRYFGKIAISETDTYDSPQKLAFKIVVQELNQPTAEKKEISSQNLKLAKTIWTITPEILPANQNTCLNAKILPCTEEIYTKAEPLSGCYNSCLVFGATFLSYDEKNQKLYLMGATQEVGQGGGRFLGFVADLKTKKIKYLKAFDGFAKGVISPDGKYILIDGKLGFLTLYNTETNQEKDIELKKVTNLKWMDNKQYSYQIVEESNNNKLSEVIIKRV